MNGYETILNNDNKKLIEINDDTKMINDAMLKIIAIKEVCCGE